VGEYRGFLVHISADKRKGRIYASGRLEDGDSFALVDESWRPSFYIPAAEAGRAATVARAFPGAAISERGIESFDGRPCVRITADLADRDACATAIAAAGIETFESDLKPRDAWLLDRGLRSGLLIKGEPVAGKRVGKLFMNPELGEAEADIALRWLSIDIETARDDTVRAMALAGSADEAKTEILLLGAPTKDPRIRSFPTEADLLLHFAQRVREIDPDVLTGWNVIEFDFRMLARRFLALGLRFDLGRSEEESRYLEGASGASSALIVSGRQTLDAMRAVRSGPERYEDMSLETVARSVLGRGKSVHERGEDKLAALDRLYEESPAEFAAYCGLDAALVVGILEKTGLDALTQMRSSLTGVGIDRAWTSIPPFEAIYARGLRKRGIAVPPVPARNRAGSPGGLILEPEPGLFENVLVLDFKSLYPTVILTFNIDPLAYARAPAGPGREAEAEGPIEAPNGARFERDRGILPEAIEDYFARREEARRRKDPIAVYVYKILMNSFYGVLGAESCRYARRELAGAVTGFGQKYLSFTRDWAGAQGFRVLYGDTDSVFLSSGLPRGTGAAALADLGKEICARLNADIARSVREEYGLESRMEIKPEKAYERFYLPRLRSGPADDGEGGDQARAPRGRAKGYAGRIAGSGEIEIKGMEAARSDWTPLARGFQERLLADIFMDRDPALIRAGVDALAKKLFRGELDEELVFRRVLRRSPEQYVKMEPPHVRAARLMGWTSRRGTVEYLMTVEGAQPTRMRTSPIDYDWYLGHQVMPILRSAAESCGLPLAPRDPGGSQMELDFDA
jgi:DNA polymerase-2